MRVGARARMSSELIDVKETRGSVQAMFKQSFEIEGDTRPACVTETVVRIFC